MKIFDAHISGSLSVSSSAEISNNLLVSGNLTVLGTVSGNISGSITNADTANRLANKEVTEFATTGSNYFKGGQTFSGSLIPSGSELFDLGSSTNRWRDLFLAGSTINLGGTKLTKDGSGNVQIKDSNNNLKNIITNEVQIGEGANSIVIKRDPSSGYFRLAGETQPFIAAQLSGSFTGSGTGLYGIPASGITGLNLSQIAEGSSTASISSTNGLRVNTNTEITGALTISGSISLNGVPVGTGKLDEITFNSYTSSNDSTNSTQSSRLTSIESATGSLNSFTSSIDTTIKNKLNTETVISGSVQVLITGTTGYSTFSSSISTSIGSLSSSVATTTSGLSSSIGSLSSSVDSLSSSIATTTSGLSSSIATTTSGLSSSIGSLSSSVATTTSELSSSIVSLSSSVATTTSGLSSSLSSSIGSLSSSVATTTSGLSSSIGSLSSSVATTTINLKNRVDSIETSTGSLNSFTSSINTTIKTKLDAESVISGSIQVIITGTTGYSTFSSSIATTTSDLSSSIGGLSSSVATTTSGLSSSIGSLSSSVATTTSGLSSSVGSLSSSVATTTSGLSSSIGSLSSSVATTTSGLSSSIATTTSGLSSSIGSLSSSVATTTLGTKNRVDSIESKTGSYATTGSNIFQGNQTITGSLYVSQDLIIAGSSSIQHISSSIVNIADNIITVNASNPSLRFGGLAVIDSGSSPQVSGSILFDSIENQWIFIHQNQATVTSSMLIMGPETYDNVGNETHLTLNRLVKSLNDEHIGDSNITDTGTKVSINSDTEVTGTLKVTGNITNPNITAIESATGSLNTFTSSINTTIKSKLDSEGVISGSIQVNHNATTNYVANQHIDHTTVSITAGSGLTGGGDISTTRTINVGAGNGITVNADDIAIDTASATFTTGVKTKMNTDTVMSGSYLGTATTANLSENASYLYYTDARVKTKLNAEGVVSGSAQIDGSLLGSNKTITIGSTSTTLGGTSTTLVGLTSVTSTALTGSLQGSISGNAGTVTNGVYTTGDQTIGGIKTFSSAITASNYSGTHTGASSGTNTGDETLSRVNALAITTVGTITSGTWNGTAIANAYLANSSFYLGSTSISLGRASATLNLAGVNTDGYSMSLNGYANQTLYTILDGPANGPVIKVRYDSATTNRYIDIGSKDGNGVYTEGLKIYNGGTLTFATYTVYHSGNIPTWNQNTTGTAANITASSNTSLTSLANLATVGTIGTGVWNGSVIGSSYGGAGTVNGLMKSNGSGTVSAATAGTDYVAPSATFFIGTTSIAHNRSTASQTLTGVSIDGNSATVTNGVYTTGDQTIAGVKTFSGRVVVEDTVGEIILSPTGWRDTNRAEIKIKSKSDVASELDFRRSQGGREPGWHFSARGSAESGDLYIYRFDQTGAGVPDTSSFVLMYQFKTNGTLVASTFSGALSGNATTATTLQTTRSIYGNNFNGSADVTGTISNAYLTNSSFNIGTTSISLGRASASQTLTGVSIDGNAATVTNATFYRQFTVRDDRSDGNDYSLANRPTGLYAITSTGSNGPGSTYSSLIHVANGTDVAFQIAGGYTSDSMYFRGTSALQSGSGYTAWRTVIHSGNYGSYALPLGGGAMTGNITFTNTSSLGTQDVGGTAWFRPRDTSNNLHIYTTSGGIYLDTNANHYFRNAAGTGRLTLDTSGNATLAGVFTENSSLRYKKDIETIKYGLDKVLQMRGVTYVRKDSEVKEIGVIAEEMNEILPDIVLKNEEGQVDSVSYGRLSAVFIEAIKELKQEINEQNLIISELKSKLDQ